MSDAVFKIWCNDSLTDDQTAEKEFLLEKTQPHDWRFFDANQNGADGAARDFLLEADIAVGQPDAETILRAANLRWIHIMSAGYAAYDRADLREELQRRGAILTNSSAVHSEPCAQHLLAMILGLLRAMPYAMNAQRGERSWLTRDLRPKLRLPENQTALIFGFGAIARRLIELLQPLKMNLIGVRREPRGNESVKIIRESEADEYLPQADHVINILPENQSTKNYFSRERLARLKSSAYFYNIGRGTTVDQAALIENLNTGKLAAAYLDVTVSEPLPPDSELWTTPNCFITPHVAGGTVDGKHREINHFLENLRRFERGAELINRII